MNLSDFYTVAQQRFEWIRSHRRWLHAHPELSFNEYNTRDYIMSVLEKLGLQPRVVARTGVTATIGSGTRCVALRADIDALPIEEQTGLPFASTNKGVMHACGHDFHTAMLLGAAALLCEAADQLNGRVLLIFQPGEEKSPGGASLVIAEGILQEFRPEAIFGQHVYPEAPTGTVQIAAGPIMASADELYWTLRGKGTHAAQPHRGANPIRAAAELIIHLDGVVQQSRNPLHPALLTITAIQGGTATNIIPHVVQLKGTLRSFNDQWRRSMWNRIIAQSKVLCALYDVECNVDIVEGYPPLICDSGATSHVEEVAKRVIGSQNIYPFEPKLWAEDFAFYAQQIPAAFWMLGCRPPEREHMPGLHSPHFTPDEAALPLGSALLAAAAMAWLSS
ncbi:MAG: M20 family metallopeptidase [Bacteroidota bacterium]|nr:M20 family metallopeptidase [Candidatus Kapabacteria bacterium]MCX7936588.1 M20 family metallopeptidase [Chlorobiota bacterium]MDW8074781.1 M20 family metallopeptidase [Bacteroidota bacterium]MDW8271420.1 M20 family metallopeptidase [Bacteroidota bacterium]